MSPEFIRKRAGEALTILKDLGSITDAGQVGLQHAVERLLKSAPKTFGAEFFRECINVANSSTDIARAFAGAFDIACYPHCQSDRTLDISPTTRDIPVETPRLDPKVIDENFIVFQILEYDHDPSMIGGHICYVTTPFPGGAMDEVSKLLGGKLQPYQLKLFGVVAKGRLAGFREGTHKGGVVEKSGGDNSELDADGHVLDAKIDEIIARAVNLNVSDVHIQPVDDKVRIRHAVQGSNIEVETIPNDRYMAFANRLMSRAGGEGGAYNTKFDNVIPYDIKDKEGRIIRRIQLRLNMMPATVPGWANLVPKFTLRLLGNTTDKRTLDQLGVPDSVENPQRLALLRMSNRTNGLFLTTGPTGSGKTSTLNALLETVKANHPDYMIYTAEDPVEMPSYGVTHLQINEGGGGLTWLAALKSFMRGAPHLCVVGEIRDLEVAKLAIELALTGHFVMSTTHTNSAVVTITRLINMGIDPFVLGDALAGVMAQRLVKQACPHCSPAVRLSDAIAGKHELLELPERSMSRLLLASIPQDYTDLYAYAKRSEDPFVRLRGEPAKVKSCRMCRGTGNKSFPAIVSELLTVSPSISQMIHDRRSSSDILRKATEEGFREMWERGFELFMNGDCTFDDVVAKLQERQPPAKLTDHLPDRRKREDQATFGGAGSHDAGAKRTSIAA